MNDFRRIFTNTLTFLPYREGYEAPSHMRG